MFNTGQSPQQLLTNIQAALVNLRSALHAVQDTYAWASGVSQADLEGLTPPFDASDAAAILSAVTDANAYAMIWGGSQPPGTYPQFSTAPYNYSASTSKIVGP